MAQERVKKPEIHSRIVQIAKTVRTEALAHAIKIGVAGNGGSFSEQAAIAYAKRRLKNEGDASVFKMIEVVWLITAEAVMEALGNKTIDYGIFAVFNNHGGAAIENWDAMLTHRVSPEVNPDGYPETVVLPIEHVLMMRRDAGKEVRDIFTQLQAHEQTRGNIERQWGKRVKVHHYPDTATAAKDLAEGNFSSDVDLSATAVIGPMNAAKLHKLDVRWRHMEDHPNNKTTFIVAKPYSK